MRRFKNISGVDQGFDDGHTVPKDGVIEGDYYAKYAYQGGPLEEIDAQPDPAGAGNSAAAQPKSRQSAPPPSIVRERLGQVPDAEKKGEPRVEIQTGSGPGASKNKG